MADKPARRVFYNTPRDLRAGGWYYLQKTGVEVSEGTDVIRISVKELRKMLREISARARRR